MDSLYFSHILFNLEEKCSQQNWDHQYQKSEHNSD